MSILRRSSEKILRSFAKEIYESAHIGAEFFSSAVLEHKQEELDNRERINLAHEIIYLLLYTTDCRLGLDFGQRRRYDTISALLSSCIELSTEEHIPQWTDQDKEKFYTDLVDSYSDRVELYAECDRKRDQGDTTVLSNYMYIFGRNVARLTNEEQDMRLILIATGLGNDLIAGAEPFEGLQLDLLISELKKCS